MRGTGPIGATGTPCLARITPVLAGTAALLLTLALTAGQSYEATSAHDATEAASRIAAQVSAAPALLAGATVAAIAAIAAYAAAPLAAIVARIARAPAVLQVSLCVACYLAGARDHRDDDTRHAVSAPSLSAPAPLDALAAEIDIWSHLSTPLHQLNVDAPLYESTSPGRNIVAIIVDSGSPYFIHNRPADMGPMTPCNETYRGADKNAECHPCVGVGSLTLDIIRSDGVPRPHTFANVRCVPGFRFTLGSVPQWEDEGVTINFGSGRSLTYPNGDTLPFTRTHERKYVIHGITTPEPPPAHAVLASDDALATDTVGAHDRRTGFHLSKLGPGALATALHRRFHFNLDTLRRTVEASRDAAALRAIHKVSNLTCPHCLAANAKPRPHPGSIEPCAPRVGARVHTDCTGRMRSSIMGYFYVVFFIDEFSRYIWAYLLKSLTELESTVLRFLADFRVTASALEVHDSHPDIVRHAVQVEGIRADNAGNYTSHLYHEYLNSEGVSPEYSPAYSKDLNPIAERTIGVIFSVVRAQQEMSGAPPTFWDSGVLNAVDVCNRAVRSGGHPLAPASASAHSIVRLSQPSILALPPYGCRVYVTIPEPQRTNKALSARGWPAINTGRSSTRVSAYRCWVPSEHKFVISCDCLFEEEEFPWRTDPLPPLLPKATATPVREPAAIRPDHARLASLAKALQVPAIPSFPFGIYLCSGPYKRNDGVKAHGLALGVPFLEFDNGNDCPGAAGGWAHDLRNDVFYDALYELAAIPGAVCIVVVSQDCSTYSYSRFWPRDPPGPPIVRSSDAPDGLDLADIPEAHHRELRDANDVNRRICDFITHAHLHGASFTMENPAPRHDSRLLGGRLHGPGSPPNAEKHGSLGLTTPVRTLAKTAGARLVTFAYCTLPAATGFPAPLSPQKYTSLMYSPDLHGTLGLLAPVLCNHTGPHPDAPHHRNADGSWPTKHLSPWPAPLCAIVAHAAAHRGTDGPSSLADVSIIGRPVNPPPKPTGRIPEPVSDDHSTQHLADPVADNSREEPDDPGPEPNAEPSPSAGRRLDFGSGPRPGGGRFNMRERSVAAASTDANDAEVLDALAIAAAEISDSDGLCLLLRSEKPTAAHCIYATNSVHLDVLAADPSIVSSRQAQLDRPRWSVAEAKELEAHARNLSWVEIDRSEFDAIARSTNTNLAASVWARKVKRNGDLKARLCVDGSRQIVGVDCDQTYSSSMRPTSLRILASVKANLRLNGRRKDLVAAYLQGDLEPDERVFFTQPPGDSPRLGRDGKPRICLAQRPIYGMRQAGRRLQRKLLPWVKAQGLTQCFYDPCVHWKREGDDILIVGIYVDDMMVLYRSGAAGSLYSNFSDALHRDWEAEDEGELLDLLNIHFRQSGDSLTLHQAPYIEKLAERFFPDGIPKRIHRNQTPHADTLPQLVSDAQLLDPDDADPVIRKRYQQLVGAILYASTQTRPDIAYATGMLSRALHKPTPALLEAAERVLIYLHLHADIGLTYEPDPTDPHAASDSDWALKKSTSGWAIMWHRAAINWGSKGQPVIALSSCEAEIIAASVAAKDTVSVRNLVTELGFPPSGPTSQATDNKAARDLAYNPEHHDRTKHIHRRHLWIRELVEHGAITVPYVRTADNIADFFTKPLRPVDFFRFRAILMNLPLGT